MLKKFLAAIAGIILTSTAYAEPGLPVVPTVGGVAVSSGNPLPVSGTFSATLAGFTPGGSYSSPLSVSNSSSNVALPTGTTVAVYNVGSNAAYCKLGSSNAVTATTSDDYIPANSAVGYTVGSNTYLACITSSSTTTVNISGGSGLLTGFGGGGSSGGGGGTSLADGATFTEGTTSFTPIGGEYVSGGGASCTTGKGCTVQMTVDRMAYVNIGKVGGAATGTAGSAGTGVLTVQGIASMTPILSTVSQATAGNLNATVVGTGTFAVQATLQASATTAIGKVDPNTIATWGLMSGTTPGTAPTNTLIIGGIYNSSLPGPTTGQTVPLQVNANGTLEVTLLGSNGAISSIGPSSDGTSASIDGLYTQARILGYNGTTWDQLRSDSNKYLYVNPNATTVAQGGASAPTNALVGGCTYNSGGQTLSNANSGALQCDSNNYLDVNVKTATGLAIGSTTSGQTGSLIMGAVTSGAAGPNYTTAQTDPLSLDLNGGLRLAPSCVGNTIPINQTSSTDVHTFTAYGYICSIVLISGTQQSISISEGTGSTCASGTAYLSGGSGGTMVLAQYGGFSAISGVPFMKLKNSADHLCVLQSSTGNVSGFITYADLTN